MRGIKDRRWLKKMAGRLRMLVRFSIDVLIDFHWFCILDGIEFCI